MYLLTLCFGFSGRTNRAQYWLGLGLAFCPYLLAYLLIRRSWLPEMPALIVFSVAALVFYFVALATAVKRLHDLNISGWWALGTLSTFLLAATFFAYAALTYAPMLALVIFACMIWLGSAKGKAGENRFGPSLISQKQKRPAPTALSKSAQGSASKVSSSMANEKSQMQRRLLLWLVTVKVMATLGALSAAFVIANFVALASDRFNAVVIGYDTYLRPTFLNGSRLDVIFALLFPISIAVWWRGPISVHRRIVACCYGIGVGFLPITVQFFTWPLIVLSPDGVWAVGALALFGAATLAISATLYFAKMQEATAPTIVPHNIRRGLLRLYVILLIPWAAWFSYTAYTANRNLVFDFDQGKEWARLDGMLEDNVGKGNPNGAEIIGYARRELGLMAEVWDAHHSTDEISTHIDESIGQNTSRLTNSIYALLAAIAPPFLYPIFLWVVAGFRKTKPISNERPAQ